MGNAKNEWKFRSEKPGSPNFGKSRKDWSASTGKALGSGGGCLMALATVPFVALMALLRKSGQGK